jgi:hypothetical protein
MQHRLPRRLLVLLLLRVCQRHGTFLKVVHRVGNRFPEVDTRRLVGTGIAPSNYPPSWEKARSAQEVDLPSLDGQSQLSRTLLVLSTTGIARYQQVVSCVQICPLTQMMHGWRTRSGGNLYPRL